MSSTEALAVCAELRLTRHASPEDMQALESKVSGLASGTRDENKKLNKHRVHLPGDRRQHETRREFG
jgi:hypothetical protein